MNKRADGSYDNDLMREAKKDPHVRVLHRPLRSEAEVEAQRKRDTKGKSSRAIRGAHPPAGYRPPEALEGE